MHQYSETDGVSGATAANSGIIGSTVEYTRKQGILWENDANIPTTHEGKCFEGAASGLP